jgi:hypothetical protein
MTSFGSRRLAKIMPNLPEPCRQELTQIQQAGWRCGFYLGVRDNRLMMCIVAGKGSAHHIVFHDEIEPLVAQLQRQIAAAAEAGGETG